MSQPPANLRISAASAHGGRTRRTVASTRNAFLARNTAGTAGRYNPLHTLKENYLQAMNTRRFALDVRNPLMDGIDPRVTYNINQNLNPIPIFSRAMDVAEQFNPRVHERGTNRAFKSAFAEYIIEMEKVIQNRLLNRDYLAPASTTLQFKQSLAYNAQRICNTGRNDIQTIAELTTGLQGLGAGFFANQNYKERWTSDFRAILDDTIKMILHTFSPDPSLSYFGQLIPGLKDYVPEGTPTGRRRPKGFIYKMDNQPDFLRVIFNIMMIRFPATTTAKQDLWKEFSYPIRVLFPPEQGTPMVLLNVTVSHTDTTLTNLFYYIPDHERVVGMWPKNVRVGYGDGDSRTLNVNYNGQMIRTVLCKFTLPENIIDQNGRIDYASLFDNPVDNLYLRIRKLDLFEIGRVYDPWVRYFVSITLFNASNDKILHVPWTIESTDQPLSPGYVRHGQPIRYDMRTLLAQIIAVLERRTSGRTNEDSDDKTTLYIMIKFINEHPTDYYRDQLQNVQEEEEGEEESKADFARNVRARNARTPQQANQKAPSMNNVLVGAPYAGTPKERLFLTRSMVNRFTFNDALFETPQRPTTYSCFMMAILRCQMYMYVFDDRGECLDVLVTNGPRPDMSCEGKFVQATMDYSKSKTPLSFIKKINDETYIHLFNSVKHTYHGKSLPGSMNEEENQYWELAADEIWIHLERFCGREINYNDLGDYGQAFADLFQVCISIYDIEYRGARISVITPQKKSPLECVREKEVLMIHLVFDQGHMHAVTNLRSFIRSKKRKSDVRQYHYCPFCDQKQTHELTLSKESALKHMTDCAKEMEEFKTGFKREEEVRIQTQHTQVRTVFKKDPKKNKSRLVYECTQCHAEVDQLSFQAHVCTIQAKKLEYLQDEKIYVWDVEAAQMEDDFHLLRHECNCVYIRRVYTDDPAEKEGRYFPSEVEFVDALMNESEFQNATFLAHNSGSYDIHFMLRIFERSEIEHTYTPSPTSKHKFIMVQLTERNVRFLDFIRFMPGSLRSIADSFQISVSKGDFPYKFNNGEHDSYIGCIPPMDTEKDWWGLKEAKSKKQVDTFRSWFQSQQEIYCTCENNQCQCSKEKWNFQTEIKKYCLLDVVVLAEVVKAYRNKVLNFETVKDQDFPDSDVSWSIPKIDPFQFMTLPQITMQTLIHGFEKDSFHNYSFSGVTSFFYPERTSRVPEALLWIKQQEELYEVNILSRENCLREFYEFSLKMSFDGYAPGTNTVFVFLKCSFWGCPHCYPDLHENNSIIPERGIPAKDVQEHYEAMMYHLNSNYQVKSIWQHDFNTSWLPPYQLECIRQMSPSDCFYGGRTEVFKLYCNSEKFPDDKIHYYDVTSLYPSVYAHRQLPIGTPRYYIGYNIERARFDPNHENRYFGYARVKILPRNTDRIGLLPQRDPKTQRLTFPVHPMIGCWFIDEIYLAMSQGYIVEEIYEIYHWGANQTSDQHLRGYVGYFLRMKQEAEGWKKLGATSDNPDPEEQERLADQLYHQNGGLARIRPDKVKLDPVMRALAKLFLNSLWGKWAQKPAKECHTTVYGTQQFFQLWNDWTVEKESCLFRDISPGVFKVSYKRKDPFINPVPHGNIWLAAAVTAWARITLHKQMIRIGPERLIYCDTDSVIFLWPKNGEKLSGIGLGHWTDEYPKNIILKVYALAPKLYALTLGDSNSSNTYESFRTKGVQMTLENQDKMSFSNILPLIERTLVDKQTSHDIEVANFSIFTNATNNQLPFGQLFSRYNKKKVRVIITKRVIQEIEEVDFEKIAEINTFPSGYVTPSIS